MADEADELRVNLRGLRLAVAREAGVGLETRKALKDGIALVERFIREELKPESEFWAQGEFPGRATSILGWVPEVDGLSVSARQSYDDAEHGTIYYGTPDVDELVRDADPKTQAFAVESLHGLFREFVGSAEVRIAADLELLRRAARGLADRPGRVGRTAVLLR